MTSLKPAHIDIRWNGSVRPASPIPNQGIITRLPAAVDQCFYFLSQHIINGQSNPGRSVQPKANHSRRIERIGVIVKKTDSLRKRNGCFGTRIFSSRLPEITGQNQHVFVLFHIY